MKELFEKIILDSVNAVRDEIVDRITDSGKKYVHRYPKNNGYYAENSGSSVQRVEFTPEKKSNIDEDFDDFIQSFNEKENKSNDEKRTTLNVSRKNSGLFEKYTNVDNANSIGVINAFNKNKRLNIMVIGAAFGLIFCLLMLTFYKGDLPGEVVGIVSTISGIFGACLKDAYSFEFGSSRGSKDKDEKISATILDRLKL